jgi:hypothetical protein
VRQKNGFFSFFGKEEKYSLCFLFRNMSTSLQSLSPSLLRVAQSPPYAFSQGLIVALSCGGVAAAAASAAALGAEVVVSGAGASAAAAGGGSETLLPPPPPPEASHAHWQRVVLPTLAAGGVGVASALLASLLVLPSLASTSVERAVAVTLKGLGAALSSSSSRFFGAGESVGEGGGGGGGGLCGGSGGGGGGGEEEKSAAATAAAVALVGGSSNGDLPSPSSLSPPPPSSTASNATALRLSNLHRLRRQETLAARPAKGAAAATLPPVLLAPHLAMKREPAESPGFEAWWDRLCAPVDAVEASSSSSSSDDDDDDDEGRKRHRRRRRRQQGPDDDRPLQASREKELLLSRRRSKLSGVSKSFARLAQSVGSLTGNSSSKRQQQQKGREGDGAERRVVEVKEKETAIALPLYAPPPPPPPPLPPPPPHNHRPKHKPPSPVRPTVLLFDMAQAPPPASNLRPLIAAARAALSSAAVEPPLLRALPSFLSRHRALRESRRPFDPAAWARLLLALDRLLTRISALEFAASNDDVFFGDGEEVEGGGEGAANGGKCSSSSLPWRREIVDAMRLAFAQAAAALAHLSEEAARGDGRPVSCGGNGGGGGRGGGGGGDVEQGRRRGGGKLDENGENGGGDLDDPADDEDDAAEELERANSSVLARSSSVGFVRSFRRTEESLHRALLEQIELHVRAVKEAAAEAATAASAAATAEEEQEEEDEAADGNGKAAPQPSSPRTLVLPSAYTARSRFFAYSLALAVVRQMTEVDAAASACFFGGDCSSVAASNARPSPSSPSPSPSSSGVPFGSWVKDLVAVFFCAPLLRRTLDRARRVAVAAWERLKRGLRRPFFRKNGNANENTDGGGDGGETKALPPFPKLGANGKRVLVAGLKYFLVTFLLLSAMLSAESGSPDVARLVPSAAFSAGALSMSEKVEATASKVASWVLATVAGGVAGGLLLVGGWLPARPALLGLAVAALAGLGAAATARTGRWRTTVVLGLLTTSAISLCRYDSDCRGGAAARAAASGAPNNNSKWCSTAGTVELVVSRIASVVVGVLVAAAVNVSIAPWFVSDWSLSALGSTLRDVSAPFIEQQYARFYAEGEAAAAATAAARAAEVEEEEEEEEGEAEKKGGKKKMSQKDFFDEYDDPFRGVAEEVAGVVARGLQRLESQKKKKKKKEEKKEKFGKGEHDGGGGREEDETGNGEEEVAEQAPPLPVISSSPPPPFPVSYSFVPFLPASALPPLSLQRDAAPRLVEVQASLARDATAWSRGVLSTPKSLQSLLRSSLSLLDALASLQVAVSTCDSYSSSSSLPHGGGLNGATHRCYVSPLAPATAEVFAALRAAAAAAADHLDAVSSSRTAWSGLSSFFSGEMGPPRQENEKGEKEKEKEKKRREEEEESDDDDDEEEEEDLDGEEGTHRHSHRHHHHSHSRHGHHHHREANAATRARLRAAIDDLRARRSVAIEAQSAARRYFHVAMARNAREAEERERRRRKSSTTETTSSKGGEEEQGGGRRSPMSAFVLPQDQLRHLATMSALIKAMNRFTAVLRAAAAC